jgi:hypothetical protein
VRDGWRGRRKLGRRMAGDALSAGALIDHLHYWERAINTGEYRVDRFHNVIASDVDEYYLLCPECGKILFDDIEVADKLLRGQPITEGEIYPEDE